MTPHLPAAPALTGSTAASGCRSDNDLSTTRPRRATQSCEFFGDGYKPKNEPTVRGGVSISNQDRAVKRNSPPFPATPLILCQAIRNCWKMQDIARNASEAEQYRGKLARRSSTPDALVPLSAFANPPPHLGHKGILAGIPANAQILLVGFGEARIFHALPRATLIIIDRRKVAVSG